ncbi:YciI family protein [Nocardia sp. NPDC059246]
MPLFVVEYTYSAETVSARDTHRAEHREWLKGLVENGTIVASGPFADKTGAFIVIVATDAATAYELFAQDPFARLNLLESTRIVEWAPVMGPLRG